MKVDEELEADDSLKFHAHSVAEKYCWICVVMTPVIWWLQGPSVSTDQFVVRCSLVVISVLGAVGLRVYRTQKQQ